MSSGRSFACGAKALLAASCLCISAGISQAGTVTVIDFESIVDGEPLGNQYIGMVFTNASVLAAGISLNEVEFPPRSGNNLAVDTEATLSIHFEAPVIRVGAYFTYTASVTLQAYDENDTLLAEATSLVAANFVSAAVPGTFPNEYIELAALGIRRVSFGTGGTGFSFTFDDLTVEADHAQVPLPATAWLAVLGLAVVPAARRHASRSR